MHDLNEHFFLSFATHNRLRGSSACEIAPFHLLFWFHMHRIGVHSLLGTLFWSAALFGNVFWNTRDSAGYAQTHICGFTLDGTNDMDTSLGLWGLIACLIKVLSVRKEEGKVFCW